MPSAARAIPKSVILTVRARRDQQVGGLHVAVHDPGLVRRTERVGGLGEQVAGGVGVQRVPGLEQGRERLAVDELHHQVGARGPGPVGGVAYTFTVCQAIDPGSFTAAVDPADDRTWMELLFLSFTTLTSTGLSDVVPVKPFARGLNMVEQVAGVTYIAMLVSRLVGLTVLGRVKAD